MLVELCFLRGRQNRQFYVVREGGACCVLLASSALSSAFPHFLCSKKLQQSSSKITFQSNIVPQRQRGKPQSATVSSKCRIEQAAVRFQEPSSRYRGSEALHCYRANSEVIAGQLAILFLSVLLDAESNVSFPGRSCLHEVALSSFTPWIERKCLLERCAKFDRIWSPDSRMWGGAIRLSVHCSQAGRSRLRRSGTKIVVKSAPCEGLRMFFVNLFLLMMRLERKKGHRSTDIERPTLFTPGVTKPYIYFSNTRNYEQGPLGRSPLTLASTTNSASCTSGSPKFHLLYVLEPSSFAGANAVHHHVQKQLVARSRARCFFPIDRKPIAPI